MRERKENDKLLFSSVRVFFFFFASSAFSFTKPLFLILMWSLPACEDRFSSIPSYRWTEKINCVMHRFPLLLKEKF